MNITPGVIVSANGRVIPATRELLEYFNRDELRDYARSLGLPQGGTKQEVIERLISSGHATVLASLGD